MVHYRIVAPIAAHQQVRRCNRGAQQLPGFAQLVVLGIQKTDKVICVLRYLYNYNV